MSHDEFENEVREIAEYLGCNDGELVSEMNALISKCGFVFAATRSDTPAKEVEV